MGQDPKVQGFQGPRYLKVTFKYELDSKEGPSGFNLSFINCQVSVVIEKITNSSRKY